MYLKIVEILNWPIETAVKCHIIVASICCWYHQTLIYIEKEHKCVSVPGVNTVSNKCFSVFTRLAHRLTWQKHSVAQYKGGWVWHGIDFFFVCFLIYWLTAQWHRQYVSSQTCLPVQALLMPPALVSLLATTGTTAQKIDELHQTKRAGCWQLTDPDQRHAEIFV